MVYVPSLALVSVSFKEHRALALATVTSGAAIGKGRHLLFSVIPR